MPVAVTRNFGRLPYDDAQVIEFPRGLPAFEDRRHFVPVHFPHSDPLMFLQSLEEPGLCFITIPILAVEPRYRLQVDAEDLALVGLPPGRRPRIGDDVLCVAVIAVRETGPTANLLAPIVVNLHNRKAVQAIASDSGYSHQHPLAPREASCS
jgi:flagellar assembly factor FliW